MSIISQRLRQKRGEREGAAQYGSSETYEEQNMVPDSGTSEADSDSSDSDDSGGSSVMDQVMNLDIKGLFNRIDNYYTNNALKRAEELKDDDGNITPESVSEAENGSNYGYDAVDDKSSLLPDYNTDPSYDHQNTQFADNLPGHIARDFRDWTDTVDNDVKTVYDSGGSEGKWKLYEDAVANPAMKIAATPFLPAPARLVAGAAAAPAFVSDAINLGKDGYDGAEGDGSGGVWGAASNIANGLVAEPLEQLGNAAMHPLDTLNSIYEHPANLWNEVLEPGMIVEGGLRAGKKANDYAYNHSERVKNAEDWVSDQEADIKTAGQKLVDSAKPYGEELLDKTGQAIDYLGNRVPHPDIIEDADWRNRRSAEYRPEEVETEPERALDIDTGSEYDSAINEACAKYGLDPALGHAVAQMESQHGKSTSNVFGVNGISDPYESIDIGVKSLKRCIDDNGGDIDAGLREYNGNANPDYVSTVHQIEGEYGGNRGNGNGGGSWDIDLGEVGNTMDNHSVGCVEAVTKLGKNNDFLGRELNNGVVYVPKLIEDAKAEGRYIDYDPSKLERGDVIVFDGDEHVMMYEGDGRIVGNSSSADKIVERNLADQGQTPTGIIKAGGARSAGNVSRDIMDDESESREIGDRNEHAFDEANKSVDTYMNEEWAPQEETERNYTDKTEPLINSEDSRQPFVSHFFDNEENAASRTTKPEKISADIFNDMSNDVKAFFGIKDAPKEEKAANAEPVREVNNEDVLDMDGVYVDGNDISFSRTNGSPVAKRNAQGLPLEDTPDLPEYTKQQNLDGIVRKQDIIERYEQLFGTPIRDGHGIKGTDGYYLRKAGAVRVSNWGDLTTMAHEIGHKIDDHMRVPNRGVLHDELKDNVERIHGEGVYEEPLINREGAADFMAEYLNEGAETAREHFPKYYEAFQNVLKTNEDMRRRIDDMSELYQRYHAQSPEARALSGVNSGRLKDSRTWTEKVGDGARKVEEWLVDDKAPLRRIDEDRSRILGRELTPEESVYKRARLATGSATTRADMLVSGKHPEMVRDAINKVYGEGTVEHAVTLKDTLSRLKKEMRKPENKEYLKASGLESGVQALDVLLAAQRFREMQDNLTKKIESQMENVRQNISNAGPSADGTVLNPVIDSIVEGLAESSQDIGAAVSDSLQQKGYKPSFTRERMEKELQNNARNQEEYSQGSYEINSSGMTGHDLLNHIHDALTQFHTKTLEDFPAAFNMNDAQRIIDSAPVALKNAADDVHKMSDNVLKILQKTGMISEEHLAKMRETYKNYFPLATDYQNDAGIARAFGPQGFANVGDPIKSIIGKDENERRQPIKSPLEMVMRNTYSLLDKAERNVVAQTVVSGLKQIDQESGKTVYTKGAGRLIEEVKAAPDEHESIFAVWENGERHSYQTLPEVYRALMSCTTPAETNFALKVLRWPTAMLRTMATIMPDFAVRNAVRDAATSRVFMKNFADTFNPRKPGYLSALYHILNNAVRGDKTYQEYKASGALNATLIGLDHDSLQGNILKYYGEHSNLDKAKAVFHGALAPFQAFSQAIETLPRLSEYMRVKEATGSQVEASMAARDVTLDFSKAGSGARHWNSIDAFFNASLQETAKIVQEAKRNPSVFAAKVGAAIVLPSVALWYLNHDQKWYQDRPDWEKNTFWFFKKGEDIIRIPKPFGLGVTFGSGTERILDYLYGSGGPKNGAGWLKSFFDAVVPSVLPSALQPIVDVMSNHSMWKHGPIVPQKLQNKPNEQQFDKNTSAMAKEIGSIFGLSPMKVDYLGKGYLGGVYTWANKTRDQGIAGAAEQMNKIFTANPGNSQALNDYYEAKQKLAQKYNGTEVGEGIRKNTAKKNYRLKQMDKTDSYNYQLLQSADKKMQIIDKSKMSDEEKQKHKVKIARDAMKMYKR